MKERLCVGLACLVLTLGAFVPQNALAQSAQDTVYTLTDDSGRVLSYYKGECEAGDEYISGDNKHYRVSEVDEGSKTARLECLGDADMPDVSWLNMEQSLPVSAIGTKKIAIYCTHSDESYRDGDGTESKEDRGGIYDVAAKLGTELEALGVTVERSDATHHPHDAGAYRRSRQTAVTLLKAQPSAIFDVHRDGIPDPDEYATTVHDQKMSKVRLLVGKSNQNKEANLSFAKQIKAIGDKLYPKLIKDIYMGKGSYNQDLAPRSVLLEFGTHTLGKSLVMASAKPMADVLYKALFGGVTGSAGASDVSGQNRQANAPEERAEPPAEPAAESSKGAGAAVWIIVALVVGLGVFAFLSTGGKGGWNKFGRSFREMTGGLFGKKPEGDE